MLCDLMRLLYSEVFVFVCGNNGKHCCSEGHEKSKL